jgi:hypothetical protein
VQNSRLGQAHPLVGKLLGGAAEVGGFLGNTLANAAPGIGREIPGTTLNHNMLLGQANTALTQDVGNAQKETPTVAPEAAAREGLETAQAGEATARTGQINNPTPTWEVHDSDAGPILYNKATGAGQHLSVDGQPVGPKLKLTQSQPIIDPTDGKPHTYMLDEKGNKVVDLGQHYERPQNVNVNAGDAAVDRLAARLSKPYQTAYDKSSAQLDNVDKTLRSIASGYKGQALALPETLTSLVSGQGTGVRVTMPELQMVGQHNGVKGDVESFINRVSGEGSMTDEDKKQLTGILREMRGILQDKIAIHSGALDAINGAESREQIQEADKIARKQLTEYEKIGAMGNRAQHFGTVNGIKVMSEDGNHWQNIVTGEEVK